MTTKIELTYAEKKALRELYGQYKSITRDDCESREEYIDARQQMLNLYAEKYPQLIEAGIGMIDLPELIYSKNQLIFINDAEEAEGKLHYDYSGRGMYGDHCPALYCDSHNDITTKAKTKIDSMGLGIVIYAEY